MTLFKAPYNTSTCAELMDHNVIIITVIFIFQDMKLSETQLTQPTMYTTKRDRFVIEAWQDTRMNWREATDTHYPDRLSLTPALSPRTLNSRNICYSYKNGEQ